MLDKYMHRQHGEMFCLFSQKTDFNISSKLFSEETICLKCQSPLFFFFVLINKGISNLLSAKLAQSDKG